MGTEESEIMIKAKKSKAHKKKNTMNEDLFIYLFPCEFLITYIYLLNNSLHKNFYGLLVDLFTGYVTIRTESQFF